MAVIELELEQSSSSLYPREDLIEMAKNHLVKVSPLSHARLRSLF